MKNVSLQNLIIAILFVVTAFWGGSSNYLYASNPFEIINSQPFISEPDEHTYQAVTEFDLKNNSSETLECKVKIIMDDLIAGHDVAICTEYCFEFVSQDWDDCPPFFLPAGSKTSDVFGIGIQAYCRPKGISGKSTVTFRTYNVANPEQFVDVQVEFTFGNVSINDVSSENFIVAYPNPTNNILSVYSEQKTINSIALFSMNGEQVLIEQNISNTNKVLNLSNLAKGRYAMVINFSDSNRKIVSVVVE